MSAIRGLRSRLTLEAPVDVADDNGGVSRSYVALDTLWAEISPAPIDGRLVDDRFVAERMEQYVTHHIRLRFRAGMTAAMRFRLGARVFVIHAIEDPDEHRRFLLCRCEEIKP